ncbi:M16 family metallopeptidase [Paludibacterium denitrificans]|uniref:M16 family metallopeptidase n=1 Tax=Paludibacterium denitrificans TaxID=2675226 RepID=UPI0035E44DA1
MYFQQLAAGSLPLALKLEADRMAHLNFANDAFKSELEVVKEERRWRTDDQPTGVLMESLYASAFVADPVRYPVIGWMDDLQHMQPDDLRQWYRHWYAPNNATLVVVGDVDPQAVIAEARRQFGALPKVAVPERRPQQEPTQTGERRLRVKAPSRLPYLAMAWKAPRLQQVNEPLPYAYTMLAAILDGQEASRLSRVLVREQQVAQAVSANYSPLSRGGALFVISAALKAGQDRPSAGDCHSPEIARIARDGVSAEELQRVRRQLQADKVYEQDSMFAQAMQIGSLESLGFSGAMMR